MIALVIYVLNVLVCAYGLYVFIWWWRKTGKATDMYIFVTLLFIAQLIEKLIHVYSGHILVTHNNPEQFVNIILSPAWYLASLPTLIVFAAMMSVLTRRIYHSYLAVRLSPEDIRHDAIPSNSVLVVSNVSKTKNFMSGVFNTNGIEYHQASELFVAFEKLVTEPQISVILIGLSAIEESGMKYKDVVSGIKKENPWSIVVAITRTPNMYELFEVRRAFFDDYMYLPISPEVLMASYSRWISRIKRWRRMKGTDRRSREGDLLDRRDLFKRVNPGKEQKETV